MPKEQKKFTSPKLGRNQKALIALATLVISLSSYIAIERKKDDAESKLRDNPYFVTAIIDGDTFAIKDGARVRLTGANTPEMGLCGSQEAKAELTKLVENKVVRLEDRYVDRYSRIVASVFVQDKEAEIYVNEVLLGTGWAGLGSFSSGVNAERLKKAHADAFTKRLGIFSPKCRLETTDRPGCEIKGNINDAGDKSYHYPGCDHYAEVIVELDKGESWFCTVKEAIAAGYQKSGVCRKPY